MVEIFQVMLQRNNVSRLRFYHDGGKLPGNSSVLSVRDGYGGSWNFNCSSEGDNWFSISGSDWRVFTRSRVDAIVTLSIEEGDDIYTIRVRQ